MTYNREKGEENCALAKPLNKEMIQSHQFLSKTTTILTEIYRTILQASIHIFSWLSSLSSRKVESSLKK